MPQKYTIKISHGAYAVKGPRDDRIKDKIKSLAPGLRRWDGDNFVWLIKPEAIQAIRQVILAFGYECSDIPPLDPRAVVPTITKEFAVEYLGASKDRGKGSKTSYGQINGYWSIEFPELVLRDWFETRMQKSDALISGQTFYQILCVVETATQEEIKKAYRRMAMQWHPDRCSEPDAKERFETINAANKILSDAITRKRYDAGLYFERQAQNRPDDFGRANKAGNTNKRGEFKPPLRCGYITVEGVQTFEKFRVAKIVAWDDITDDRGRVMVSSWNKSAGPIDRETGKPKGAVEIKWY